MISILFLEGVGVFVVYCRVKLWVGGGSVGLTNQITAYKTFAEQCDLNWPELNYGINLIPKLYSVTFHHGINLMPKFGTPRYPQNLCRTVWPELNHGINLMPKQYFVAFHHGINLMPKQYFVAFHHAWH